MQIKKIISLLKNSLFHWESHRAQRMGAALSYYAIFSIIPLLTIVLMIVGSFLDNNYLQTAIVEQTRTFSNIQNADFIKSIIIGISETKFNFFTVLITLSTLIVGALGVFYELKNSLDDLWDTVQSKKEARSWKYFFSSRLLSLSIIPILGFLLVISLVFSALLSVISEYAPILTQTTSLFQIVTFIFSFFVLNFLFIFIYRFLPKRKLPWKELVYGSLITTVLFIIGKFIIGLYITEFARTSIFGAAGAFVLLLLWVYYSVQIFLFGASLTYIYSKRYGHLRDK